MTRPPLPLENVYGHTKKLRYILERVAGFRQHRGGPIRLLDFGCGNGEAVSRYLVGEGVDYTGVDFHAPSLSHAREILAGPGVCFAEALPADGVFDLIVCADLIEHLPEPVAVLRELRSRLAEGGILVAAVPNGFGPFELESWIGHRTGFTALVNFVVGNFNRLWFRWAGWPDERQLPYNVESGHVQFFTRSRLRDTLSAAGWAIEDFCNGCFIGGPVSARLLNGRWLLRANGAIAERLPAWAVSTWYFTARGHGLPVGSTRGDPT